jgi:translocation and assembly module TamB
MRRFTVIITVLLIIALVFFLLRGPYLSNSIKRIIQPVLEKVIGERIIIDRAVINLFPLYLQTKGFKVFDKEGNRLLWVTKMRAYVDVVSLFSGRLKIRRLTVREPNLTIEEEHLYKIIKRLGVSDDGSDKEKSSFGIKTIKLSEGKFDIRENKRNIMVAGKGLSIETNTGKRTDIEFSLKEGLLKFPGIHEVDAGLNGRAVLDGRKIIIKSLKVNSNSSRFETTGKAVLSDNKRIEEGMFSGRADVVVKTIASIFGLKKRSDGEIKLSGKVEFVPLDFSDKNSKNRTGVMLDVKTKGWFYLQTLMELVGVHNKNIKGRLSVNGRINGIFPDLSGKGTAQLEDALLGGLAIDTMTGKVDYKENVFNLRGFSGRVYNGWLNGDARLSILSGEYYVEASAKDINSKKFFKFIHWQPPFPTGSINGSFVLHKKPGRKIELTANAKYTNPLYKTAQHLYERVKTIDTEVDFKENIITFHQALFSTPESILSLKGSIDLSIKNIGMDIELKGQDVADVTMPYFDGLKAPFNLTGRIEGDIKEPEITGIVMIQNGVLNGEPFSEITGDFTYSPKRLEVGLLRATTNSSTYEVTGSIDFRKTEGLFSFKKPFYKGKAVIKNGEAEAIFSTIYRRLPVEGKVNGDIEFEGDAERFSGDSDIILENGIIYGQPVDKAHIISRLFNDRLQFVNVDIYRKSSYLKGNGTIFFDSGYEAKILSENLWIKDIELLNKYPVDAKLIVDISGSGTFKEPGADFSVLIKDTNFRGMHAGGGSIKGVLKGRKIKATCSLFDGITTADVSIFLSNDIPWDATIEFHKGRYDVLFAGFLKDVPRDLSTSLSGRVLLKGKKKTFSATSHFNSLFISLYGYSFKNKGDLQIDYLNEMVKIRSFTLTGRDANVTVKGSARLRGDYNLSLNGNVNLTPLKALFKSIEFLKGGARFVLDVTGAWKMPELKGEINLRDTMVKISGLTHIIGPINGDVFIDKNRITLESFQTNFAGGNIILSGTGYLKGISAERLLLSSRLDNIRLRPMDGIDLAFDGELFFERTPRRQDILGEIYVKKAYYRRRIEWKSWLLKMGEVEGTTMRKPSFLSNTFLNVRIRGDRDIFIDNNLARTPLKMDLNLQGTLGQFGLVGRAEAEGGKIFFRNNEFDIIDGNVDFIEVNRIIPIFHILAETYTGGYRIRFNLDGPVDNFDLTFFSDPPLSDMQILTLLASGRVTQEEKGLESGIGAGEATAFLTGGLQDVLEERLKNIAGFDRFELNPETTATGAVSPKVTIGKRLLGQRLFVTYTTSMGTTEENIVKLQYDVTKRVSLIGMRDEIGSLGADIKFRFEFK